MPRGGPSLEEDSFPFLLAETQHDQARKCPVSLQEAQHTSSRPWKSSRVGGTCWRAVPASAEAPVASYLAWAVAQPKASQSVG